jgi:preprotein translocase subunit SecE
MFLTNDRVFLYSLYALGGVVWFVLWKLLSTIYNYVPIFSLRSSKSAPVLLPVVALAVAVALVELARRNAKVKDYGVDVVVETKKVTFPTAKELQGSTLIVILMSLVATVIIFGLDKIFDELIKLIF